MRTRLTKKTAVEFFGNDFPNQNAPQQQPEPQQQSPMPAYEEEPAITPTQALKNHKDSAEGYLEEIKNIEQSLQDLIREIDEDETVARSKGGGNQVKEFSDLYREYIGIHQTLLAAELMLKDILNGGK